MGGIIGGGILIILGIIHLVSPDTISKLIKSVYVKSPFVKNEEALSVRKGFILAFGIVWLLLGLFLVIQNRL